MKLSLRLFQVIASKGVNFVFWNYLIFKSKLLSRREIKLLFSNTMGPGWENNIRHGFHYTKHKYEFKEFSSKNIKNYDCVVPISITDLIFSDEIRNLIPNNPLPIPSKVSILLCNDKYLFNMELIKKGYEKLIPKMDADLTYPYILKKKVDASGGNSHIIFGMKEEQDFKEIMANSDFFTQELVVGSYEYATHILFKNGKILRSLNIKYVFDNDFSIKGKDKQLYTRITHCPYLDTFTAILSSIGFEGLCCVNYKVRGKCPMIIEINPRCGYSLSPYLFYFIERVL